MAALLREKLMALSEPLLERLGYELVDLEYVPGRARAVVRRVHRPPAGVGLDDCERVSHELSALFDVEDPVPTRVHAGSVLAGVGPRAAHAGAFSALRRGSCLGGVEDRPGRAAALHWPARDASARMALN